MADTKSKADRSRNMAAIKGKDTKPEMIVRKYLFSKGLRFRVHVKKLAGSPDIVLPKYKTVIFVNGCFWHGHDGCKYSHLPKSNEFFWSQKIRRNKARDIANDYVLQTLGWRVLRVWECELRNKPKRDETLDKIYNSLELAESTSYNFQETDIPMVAEPETGYSGRS